MSMTLCDVIFMDRYWSLYLMELFLMERRYGRTNLENIWHFNAFYKYYTFTSNTTFLMHTRPNTKSWKRRKVQNGRRVWDWDFVICQFAGGIPVQSTIIAATHGSTQCSVLLSPISAITQRTVKAPDAWDTKGNMMRRDTNGHRRAQTDSICAALPMTVPIGVQTKRAKEQKTGRRTCSNTLKSDQKLHPPQNRGVHY